MAGVSLLLELHPPGRNLEVLPDDVFLVSYPKSGNTWTRFLIGNLAYPDTPADFANINELIPDPEALSKRKMAAMRRPRIIKSHQYFDPRYPRIIYIVRDPRDVVLSAYHFQRKGKVIPDDYPVRDFVKAFVSSVDKPYGSWGDNVAGWLATRYGSPAFLLVRYEDMIESAQRELSRVASFLGISPDPERIREAVERSTADKMRKLEKQQAMMWSSTKDTRQDIRFVRAAKSQNWQTELPKESVAEIEKAWGPLMRWLGYELAMNTENEQGGFAMAESLLGTRRV